MVFYARWWARSGETPDTSQSPRDTVIANFVLQPEGRAGFTKPER